MDVAESQLVHSCHTITNDILSIDVKDFEQRLNEVAKRRIGKHTRKMPHLSRINLDKDLSPCKQQRYPYCGKNILIHYPLQNERMKQYNKITVRCMICKKQKETRMSQWREDVAKSKKSE